jgi:hypothetical protein
MTPAAQTKEGISFGPFSLIAAERPLKRGGAPVELSRAGGRHFNRSFVQS